MEIRVPFRKPEPSSPSFFFSAPEIRPRTVWLPRLATRRRQVDDLADRDLRLDRVEEADELLMAVALHAAADDECCAQ
jgi:hypothetical protein